MKLPTRPIEPSFPIKPQLPLEYTQKIKEMDIDFSEDSYEMISVPTFNKKLEQYCESNNIPLGEIFVDVSGRRFEIVRVSQVKRPENSYKKEMALYGEKLKKYEEKHKKYMSDMAAYREKYKIYKEEMAVYNKETLISQKAFIEKELVKLEKQASKKSK
jgi:hypothetical protein